MAKKTVRKHKQPIEGRKVLGVTASIKNLMIAVALLFAFVGGFFQIYTWIDTTYARVKHVLRIEAKQDLMDGTDVLNAMYTRYWTLDNMFNLSPDPSKVPLELKAEFNDLKNRIKLQEEKVKILQEKVCKGQ